MSNRPYTTDTTDEASAVQLELLRKMSCQERFTKMLALTSRVRKMAFDAIRRRHPDWNEKQVRLKFIEISYGEKLANDLEQWLAERSVGAP